MRTRRFLLALVVLSFSLSLVAQEETRPESNLDLRGAQELLRLREHKAALSIGLERTASGDYFLSSASKGADQRLKISRQEAQRLDEDFSALFLKLQYEMPADPAGCAVGWSLILRGEEFRVCEKSEQKSQAIEPLRSSLKRHFTP